MQERVCDIEDLVFCNVVCYQQNIDLDLLGHYILGYRCHNRQNFRELPKFAEAPGRPSQAREARSSRSSFSAFDGN
jgi:hypothetical protein